MKLQFLSLLLSIGPVALYSQKWFDDQSIDCTVLQEKKVNDKYVPHGTGFLLYSYKEDRPYTLVTCEHVLRNTEIYVIVEADTSIISYMMKLNQTSIFFGKNLWELDNGNLRARIDLIEDVTFVKHGHLDIAAIPIDIHSKFYIHNESEKTEIKISNVEGIPRSQIKYKKDVSLGDDVYFLGFPFMIGTKNGYIMPSNLGTISVGSYNEDISNPVLRSGSIGWISKKNDEFLLDAFSYGGNSGSPLFLKKSDGKPGPFLVGMVIGHLGEELIFTLEKDSNKVKNLSPEGNAGLARCLWIDDLLEVVNKAEKLK